ESQKILGILSHQFLQAVAGAPSRVQILGSELRVVPDHLLVIPSVEIRRWLATVARRTAVNPVARLVRDYRAQLAGRHVVLSRELRFEQEGHAGNAKKSPVGEI